jgi:hypothetical protein
MLDSPISSHKKLKSHGDIRIGDRFAMWNYADLLETTKLSLRSVNKEKALDHPDYIVDIIAKLPMHDRRSWLRKAARIRGESREISVSDVVDFIKGLSREINDSEFAALLELKHDKHRSHDTAKDRDKTPSVRSYFITDSQEAISTIFLFLPLAQ